MIQPLRRVVFHAERENFRFPRGGGQFQLYRLADRTATMGLKV